MKSINWSTMIKPYQGANHLKSYWQIFSTLTLYGATWYVAYHAYQISAWLLIPLAIFAQMFYLRLFIILHDCGHGSFFKQKKKRDFWGTFMGVLTFTPYHQWTTEHAVHHKHSGNLDHRGRGDIWTMTIKEYQEASGWNKFLYHLYRFPPFMLIFGGLLFFGLMHRFSTKDDGPIQKQSVWITNLGIAVCALGISWAAGFGFYLLFQLLLVTFGGLFGIGLFYVQHQFEGVYWRDTKEWDYEQAALHGCSYLKLPRLFQWASGNIGFHHIHHLSPLIPNYELERVYNEQEIFQNADITLTMKDIYHCFTLHLYDDGKREMVTFKAAKTWEPMVGPMPAEAS